MNKIFQALVILLVVSFSLLPFLVSHAEVVEDSWTTLDPMPTARSGLGVAVVNGKIYAIGGWNGGGGAVAVNEEYDPVTNTWITKTPMSVPRRTFGIAVYQNKIYVIGGASGTDPNTGSDILCSFNEVYDPLTDTWSTNGSLPTPRRGLDAIVVDDKIYLIGGYRYISGRIQEFNTNEVYDPSTGTWTTKTPLPTSTSFYASAVFDNKIYVIGGPGRKINQIYDPETDTWSYGASAPIEVNGAAAGATTGVAAPKRIHIMGGGVPFFPSKANLIYDPERDAWSTCTDMPTARDNLGVAVVDDVLYAIGGLIFTGELAGTPVGAVERYTPFGYGTIPPTISIVSPENKTYTKNKVTLTFTVNKPTSWMGYSLDGQDNITINGNTTLTGLSNGSHSITVYATDVAGNTGTSGTIYFSITQRTEPQPSNPFPITWIVAVIFIVTVAVIGVALLVYFRKIRKTTGKAEK